MSRRDEMTAEQQIEANYREAREAWRAALKAVAGLRVEAVRSAAEEGTTMAPTTGPTYMIRRDQSDLDQFGLLPALEEYDIDVEAETDTYVIFQASPEKVHSLACNWEVLICPPGIYGGHPEAILRVNSDGAISYHTTVYHAAAYETLTNEDYLSCYGIEYASLS